MVCNVRVGVYYSYLGLSYSLVYLYVMLYGLVGTSIIIICSLISFVWRDDNF